jgi:uncharacterized protein (DUF1810 family)
MVYRVIMKYLNTSSSWKSMILFIFPEIGKYSHSHHPYWMSDKKEQKRYKESSWWAPVFLAQDQSNFVWTSKFFNLYLELYKTTTTTPTLTQYGLQSHNEVSEYFFILEINRTIWNMVWYVTLFLFTSTCSLYDCEDKQPVVYMIVKTNNLYSSL